MTTKRKPKLKWKPIAGSDSDNIDEVCLADVVLDLSAVKACCKLDDLYFQRADHSPTICGYRVACHNCGRDGEWTDWSWERAVALWNIALWNPAYRGNQPMVLADKIEKFDCWDVSVADVVCLIRMLREAPRWLRALTVELEEKKVYGKLREVDDA